jgi:histidine triad (HIT) family protein
MAMKDQKPVTSSHFVVFPTKKIAGLSDVTEDHAKLLGHMMKVVAQVAKEQGLTDGYRTVVNNGKHGVQTEPYLLIHVIGGQQLKWPPGVNPETEEKKEPEKTNEVAELTDLLDSLLIQPKAEEEKIDHKA